MVVFHHLLDINNHGLPHKKQYGIKGFSKCPTLQKRHRFLVSLELNLKMPSTRRVLPTTTTTCHAWMIMHPIIHLNTIGTIKSSFPKGKGDDGFLWKKS